MKKVILLIFALLVIRAADAQDQAIFTQYNVYPILINPSLSGFSGQHQFILNGRAQWSGFPGAPQSYQAQYSGPIGNTFGIGVGVLAESAAQINRVRGFLNAAFRFDIGKKVQLTLGFSNELTNINVDDEVLAEESFYQAGDEIVENAVGGFNEYDASLGAYILIKDRTFVGLTFANLVRAQLDDIGSTAGSDNSLLEYYIFNLGHRFDVYDLNFSLEPSVMIRSIRDVPFNMDFNLKAGFLDDQLITGLSYRTIGAMGILLGTRISDINIFYGYDMSFQRFQRFNAGSHELSIAFTLKNKKPEDKRY